MKKNAVAHEFQTLKDDAQALLSATADVAGERVAEARNRVTAALEKEKTYHAGKRRTRQGHDNVSVASLSNDGIAFGLGRSWDSS
jgi:ElaB/YqjD/DUF883 family membrane-anchored ribosome-binding protein